ncbi:hypothetical protein B0H14DRAFT_2782577 [Mycena olivaceomarginata]|nr:hypothetical protein B0H14DRAFT_2782577 [Mycena olivaceomarginata]
MQRYPPLYKPAPQPVIPAPHAHTQRSTKTYPAPCIKYPAAGPTRSVWGDAIEDSDSDDDDRTVGAFTTTSIASSQSRAPGNKPKQQRRVRSWVDDTSHYTSEFKSPSVPASRAPSSAPHGKHHHHESHRGHHGRPELREREPPPIWVPRHTVQQPLRQKASQPPLFQQAPVPYAPPQPVQYQPQVVWMPVHPPSAGPMRVNGHHEIPFAPPPRAATVPHGRLKGQGGGAHGRGGH